jgi:serine/threonine-protein phosphatase PP1 catalytic subunit
MSSDLARDLFDYLLTQQRLADGARVQLNMEEVVEVNATVTPILSEDRVLLHLPAPIVIVGDIHGQFTDLLRYFKLAGNLGERPWLFLGDYVDRGYNSLEVITFLFCAKILFPEKVFLLRGNHETREQSEIGGFKTECIDRFGDVNGLCAWSSFLAAFNHLPLAAVVGKRLFCVHGGISEDLPNVADMEADPRFRRPLDNLKQGPVLDLLWADPSKTELLFAPSERGVGSTFGADAVADFLCENNMDVIVRAHEVAMAGYEFPFDPDRSVLTVFSCPNYAHECSNSGAILLVDAELRCSFKVLYSREPWDSFESRAESEQLTMDTVKQTEHRATASPPKPPV